MMLGARSGPHDPVGAGVRDGCGRAASDKQFWFVVHGVLLNAIGGAGLLGNGLSMLVLSRPQMRSSINGLPVGLAACDTVLILTSVLLFGLTAIYPYTGGLHYYYYYYNVCPLITLYSYPIANVARTMSVYLALIVTVERWVAVCHLFRAKALCTAAFACANNAPTFFEAEVIPVSDPITEEVIYWVQADMNFQTDNYEVICIHWMYLVVMYIVPFSALAGLNACIVRQVRCAQVKRARLSREQRRELGLATMFLVVVLVFFLCNILPLVTNAFEVFLGDEFDNLDPLVKASNLLVTINISVNFVIYMIFGEKFKRVFLKLFCAARIRARGARDSSEHMRDDSLASFGERMSLRLAQNSTLRRSKRLSRMRPRRASPSPAVYYPAPLSFSHITELTDANGSPLATTPPSPALERSRTSSLLTAV